MANDVLGFSEIDADQVAGAGGKGAVLARLFRQGYPVPDGFIIFPSAFENEHLAEHVWPDVRARLDDIRHNGDGVRFAVRSSALSEDSARASFAGEFETVLDVSSDEEVREAIAAVHKSKDAERVKVYSEVHNIDEAHDIAVVVQRMIPADISGVLFTADPVTGSYASMTGNYVHGLGEQLVSGETDAESFRFMRPDGDYEGPQALEKHASSLYELALRLEKDLGQAQDIEWAIAGGRLYLLQARPITTLSAGNLDTYEINDSLMEDALWINTNVAEAIPDVFTPLTWSVIRKLDVETQFIPGYYLWSGNIAGRVYSNISRRVSAIVAITGWDVRRVLDLLGDLFGRAPQELSVPIYPFSRFRLLRQMAPNMLRMIANTAKATLRLQSFLDDNPQWVRRMTRRIGDVQNSRALYTVWNDEMWPYIVRSWWSHTAGSVRLVNVMSVERQLSELVGVEDTNTLLSNLRGESELASLGPVVGVARVVNGQMTAEAYLEQYGHRGPHELELSRPHPAEDPEWLQRQIAEFDQTQMDVEALLDRQQAQFEAAKRRFDERYPRKTRWLDKQLAKVSKAAHLREAARSEFTRVFTAIRAFMLRADELTGAGDDIFFYYLDEILEQLAGNVPAPAFLDARKANYEQYKRLPPFPSFIRGRFNPSEWAQDPRRRTDYYDPTAPVETPDSQLLKGVPGAAGRVQGVVRILQTPEQGQLLQPGEILVATTTNVGWTPLFPRAAAIITDVGASLSHAAIVARELGIPAVVGCGRATTTLQNGDRVIVDGGRGTVELLEDTWPHESGSSS